MALTPPDIRIRIYQLEDGGADLQKKVSPAQVEYQTTSATPDFHLISMSNVTESIEIDKGVYEIDSVTMEVDGLSESFFNAYSDPLNEPFVCEIFDNNDAEVIFHGVIDRDTVFYNPRTQYTEFDILSWTYVLEQTSAASRSVYETKLTKEYKRSSDPANAGVTTVTIPRTADDGTDMSGNIVAGDVAVMQTAFGEWRATILGIVTTTASEIEILIIGEPENQVLTSYAAPAVDVEYRSYQSRVNSYFDTIRIQIQDATAWAELDAIRDEISSNDTIDVRENSILNVVATFPTSGDQTNKQIFPNGTKNLVTSDGRVGDNPNAWSLSDDELTFYIYMTAPQAYIDDAVANGITLDSISIPTNIDKGSKIRILGKDVYGYAPVTAPAFAQEYAPDQVIEGLFSLAETGVFQYVADTFNYPTGFTNRRWPRFLEWPDNLLESLRVMQNTERSFLKITPTLDGSELPRITVELIDRNDVNTATIGAATAISGIKSYSEQGADQTPRGVRTKPYVDYMIPRGLKQYDSAGFWYDGFNEADFRTKVPPKGSDVPEFEINRLPSWNNGLIWASNRRGVFNPDNYRSFARYFYEFYENLPRKADISVNGKVSRSVLGGFISINEGGVSRTIFVTKRTYNPITRDTDLSGYVGEYTPAFSENPVAIIDGDLTYRDDGATGSANIYLSGARSFHPGGLPLTFEWTLDPLGTPTSIGTDPVLNGYSLAAGTHTIRLTVNDGTNTDTADVTVVVGGDAADGESETSIEADFQNGPYLSVDTAGDVTIVAGGDPIYTKQTGGVVVDYSTTSATGPWTPASGSPYNNPISSPATIYTGLAEGTTLWVRVQLLNKDGTTSSNEFIGQISNVLGGAMDSLTINTLLDLDGSFDMDGGAADTFSVTIDAQEYLLIDNTGVLFDLAAGDTFDINNDTGTVFTVDDTGLEFFVLSGDQFIVDVIGLDTLIIDETGVKWDVATGDTYTWDVNSVLVMTLDSTKLDLDVNLDLGTNNISAVGNIVASGTINATGDIDSAGDVQGATLTADNGFTGSWTNAEGDVVTVVAGIVTGVAPAAPQVSAMFYITDPSTGTNGDIRSLTP